MFPAKTLRLKALTNWVRQALASSASSPCTAERAVNWLSKPSRCRRGEGRVLSTLQRRAASSPGSAEATPPPAPEEHGRSVNHLCA